VLDLKSVISSPASIRSGARRFIDAANMATGFGGTGP
jgi:hypothetical protein